MKTNDCPTMLKMRPNGLTLVEMLVVVALTVLIMSIVVEVLVLASATVNQLRATTSVHQTVRAIESVIRSDIESRTIREVAPTMSREVRNDFLPGADGKPGKESIDDDNNGTVDDLSERGAIGSDDILVEYEYFAPLGIDPAQGLGFFMLEENSVADEQGEDCDDVLHLTIRYPMSQINQVGGVPVGYYGRAVPGSEPDAAFPPSGDGIAGSMEAEVIYFVRGGTLYRRQLLVGVPQPSASFFNANRSWYEQYDISARPPLTNSALPDVNSLGDLTYRSARYGQCAPRNYYGPDDVAFNSDDLGLAADRPNDAYFPFGPMPVTTPQLPHLSFNERLADPMNRWTIIKNGYHDVIDHHNRLADDPEGDNRTSGGGTLYPIPTTAQPPKGELWWGRPTLRETSSISWDYPTKFDPTLGPWSLNVRNALTNAPPANQPWGLRQFDPPNVPVPLATRVAEDVLLTGVRSFDIKVWDPDGGGATLGSIGAGAFVDLGYGLEDIFAGTSGNGPFGTFGPPPGPYPSTGSIGGKGNFDDFLALSPLNANLIALNNYLNPGKPMVDLNDISWPPERGRTTRGFGTPWGGFISYPPHSLGMSSAPSVLWRTYDTWCSAYSKPDLGVPPTSSPNANITRGATAPPYVVPLRGIQIKIRFTEPESGQTREITLVQELL